MDENRDCISERYHDIHRIAISQRGSAEDDYAVLMHSQLHQDAYIPQKANNHHSSSTFDQVLCCTLHVDTKHEDGYSSLRTSLSWVHSLCLPQCANYQVPSRLLIAVQSRRKGKLCAEMNMAQIQLCSMHVHTLMHACNVQVLKKRVVKA